MHPHASGFAVLVSRTQSRAAAVWLPAFAGAMLQLVWQAADHCTAWCTCSAELYPPLYCREGFTETSIMSYTLKFASSFYGPFRDALESAPKSGGPSNR